MKNLKNTEESKEQSEVFSYSSLHRIVVQLHAGFMFLWVWQILDNMIYFYHYIKQDELL